MQEQWTLPTQREPEAKSVHGRQMVQNHMGGYVYALTDLKRLERFVVMGSEDGTYYVTKETFKSENAMALSRLIRDGKGPVAVELIRNISIERRNVKQNPLIFALALCARSNDAKTKEAAYKMVNEVCRIPTHLFMFIKFCEQESSPSTGWGRAHKTAIQRWYKQFETKPERFARLVTKFKNREGWTHKDVLRLAHPVPAQSGCGFILRWILHGYTEAYNQYLAAGIHETSSSEAEIARIARLMKMYDNALKCTNADELSSMITEYKLTWEHVPTTMLNNATVWKALLKHMPIEALICNLGRMTKVGIFPDNSEEEEIAVEKIRNINTEIEVNEDDDISGRPGRINKIHPFKIFVGLKSYRQGHADKGKLTWVPNGRIIDALDSAFYQAFSHVEPTGKKFFLAVDVSRSMSPSVLGTSSVSCAMAAATMMMTCVRTENVPVIRGFSDIQVDLGITAADNLQQVLQKTTNGQNFGPTDCALPMLWAIENKHLDIDVFIIYTDNETWYGDVHPAQALRNYREYAQKPNAKLIVCGMCANNFSIADPSDPGMLDIAGFDSSVPQLIADFSRDMF